ncbi:hypothetical protein M413DRAFT_14108 [Hebeloma cylindrosporum]|uniref:Cep57 centrosome microtubule-binding domain-containing protein n=1 Tax=Hebeloma cylindrosporum TaxID=76867 RepID=A0A0C2Y5G4_HEBCY|nr:hypothetical protein M413DRAFT_14108 [Hebeloma cylindrosporum h7]
MLLHLDLPFQRVAGLLDEGDFCTTVINDDGFDLIAAEVEESWSNLSNASCHPRDKGSKTNNNAAANDVRPEEDETYEGSDGADIGRGVGSATNGKGKDRKERESERPFPLAPGRKRGLPTGHSEIGGQFHKSVYAELVDQYKVMDTVSDVSRFNLLARHLREVVDILELKGNQIMSLYDLL